MFFFSFFFFFQAEDGIRDVAVTGVQTCALPISLPAILRGGAPAPSPPHRAAPGLPCHRRHHVVAGAVTCARPAAGERSEERRVGKSVDLGGRRIIKKKKKEYE